MAQGPLTVAVAAGITAAGSLGGALLTSTAAQSAAKTQADAERAALQMANANLQPIIAQGATLAGAAMPALTQIATPGGAANVIGTLPGYQFAQQQAAKQGMNAASIMGMGGNAAYGITQTAAGIAQGYWGQYVQALQNMAQLGLQTQVGAAGTLTGAQTSALVGQANALASGTLGSANALAGGLGGLTNAGLIYALGKNNPGLLGGSTGTPTAEQGLAAANQQFGTYSPTVAMYT
ncbi:MAG: hypothetical protein C5B60_05855 [Chloroflexi bacterium]|nr:MAG: hypothetical protein C5B60_05855 [Chloroflexota bacterium]